MMPAKKKAQEAILQIHSLRVHALAYFSPLPQSHCAAIAQLPALLAQAVKPSRLAPRSARLRQRGDKRRNESLGDSVPQDRRRASCRMAERPSRKATHRTAQVFVKGPR